MIIDENSIEINGYKIAPYILQAEFGWNKVWGKDTGRNMKGSMSGTLLGIVVKIKLTFGPLSQEEIEIISPLLNSERQEVKYYDPDLREMNEIETYIGDWSTLQKNCFSDIAKANESFDVSIIARDPRPPVYVQYGE